VSSFTARRPDDDLDDVADKMDDLVLKCAHK